MTHDIVALLQAQATTRAYLKRKDCTMSSSSGKFYDDVQCSFKQHLQQELKQSQTEVLLKDGESMEDGVSTKMFPGDINILGHADDAPLESDVRAVRSQFFSDAKVLQTPLNLLLPQVTVAGEKGTANGDWKVVQADQKVVLWAFFLVMVEKKLESGKGIEESTDVYEKMSKASVAIDVMLLAMQPEDTLWAEWNKSSDLSVVSLQTSTDRFSYIFHFMVKLQAERQKKNLAVKVQRTDIFKAFVTAEKEGKFTTPQGKKGIRRQQDVDSVMASGELLRVWKLYGACYMADPWEL